MPAQSRRRGLARGRELLQERQRLGLVDREQRLHPARDARQHRPAISLAGRPALRDQPLHRRAREQGQIAGRHQPPRPLAPQGGEKARERATHARGIREPRQRRRRPARRPAAEQDHGTAARELERREDAVEQALAAHLERLLRAPHPAAGAADEHRRPQRRERRRRRVLRAGPGRLLPHRCSVAARGAALESPHRNHPGRHPRTTQRSERRPRRSRAMTQPPFIGRYRIDSEVGRGGMGIVYRAVDPELDRAVAIKLILLPADASEHVRQELDVRFRREAKAAARIRHPGVVAIHDVGSTSSGLFLVMELVEGESLARRLERGAFPSRAQALELAARAAEALAAAHRAGVVPRDVKPANILLSSDGRVLLTDFGVARSLDEVSELTRTGMVVGSPAYMAPEQLQGAPVDGRADLFSLGVVLYELLLRKRPFPAQSITTLLYQILHEDPLADPALMRELDPAAASVLRRLLAKQPAQRFSDAAAVAAELRRLPREAPRTAAAYETEAPTLHTPAVAPLAAAALTPPHAPPAWSHAPAAAPPPPPSSPRLAASTDPGTGGGYPAPARGGVPAVVWVALGALLLAVVAVGGVVAWWQLAPSRPSLERGGPAVGWDPAAAGALPEPSYAVTGTPAPLPTPAAGAPAGPPPATPPPPMLAAAPLATAPPRPGPVEPAREPEPPPAPQQEPEPAPEPARPAREPEPAAAVAGHYTVRHGIELDIAPYEAEIFVKIGRA